MNQKLPAIPFFGSGPVAAQALELLLDWQPISCVITKAAPPHHKDPAPVEQLATKHELQIYYANNRTELDAVIDSLDHPLSYGIVIDYGVIISDYAIKSFPSGIINSHFSLLPEWRGADPLTYTILSGQQTTAISLMLIDKGMDTGDILAQATYDIPNAYTTPQLTQDLIDLSDATLREIIPLWHQGQCIPIPQSNIIASSGRKPTYSAKISKQDGVIDTGKDVTELERQIRAYSGWPGSRILLKGTWLTIISAVVNDTTLTAGKLAWKDKKLLLGCAKGSLEITELKPQGKNKMSASAFVNGYAHLLNS